MRLLVWNCGGALHKKLETIHQLRPDVAIISEAYSPERIPEMGFGSSAWCGNLSYKGLGIYGFGDWNVKQSQPFDPNLEYVLPTHVTGPGGQEVDLFGVWAQNHRASAHYPDCRRVPQAHVMLDKMEIDPVRRPTIVAGDFNHGAEFDRPPRKTSFVDMAGAFASSGLRSIYHQHTGDAFGEESGPTHWWRNRTKDGPSYHIDYIWASSKLAQESKFRIGTFEESVTVGRSDHAWMLADFAV